MKYRFSSALAVLALCTAFSASAQPSQVVGDNSTGSLQNIGDVDNTKSSSTSTQVNPSANNNGNGLANNSDIRSQINPNINPTTTSNATGAILGNDSNASASNGNQSMGQANTGNSSVGATTATTGPVNATTGASTSNVKDSGNATQGQQQANFGVNKSDNTNNNAVTGGAQTQTTNGVNKSANNLTGGAQNLTGGAQTLTGGAQNASTRSGVDNSGNVGLTVDASSTNNSRYDGRSLFIPPVIPQTPASQLAVGNIIKETTACGPLKRVRKTSIDGVDIGWFYNTTVQQGERYDIEDDYWYDSRNEPQVFREVKIGNQIRYGGTQAIIFVTVAGTATAKNIGLGGGGGSNMGWGQAGGGNSGSMQQLVTNIQLVSCILEPERPIIVPQRQETRPTPPQRDPCIVDRKPTKKNRATTMWVCAIEE